MTLKDEINNILKKNNIKASNIGLVESLPITLKLDLLSLVTTRLAEGRGNNPVYNGFSYRHPFLHLISLYNQATDIYNHTSYYLFLKAGIKFTERLLKAHIRGTENE